MSLRPKTEHPVAPMFRMSPPSAEATGVIFGDKKITEALQALKDDLKALEVRVANVSTRMRNKELTTAFLLDTLFIKGRRGSEILPNEEGVLRAHGVHAYFGLLRAGGKLAQPTRQDQFKIASLEDLRSVYNPRNMGEWERADVTAVAALSRQEEMGGQ